MLFFCVDGEWHPFFSEPVYQEILLALDDAVETLLTSITSIFPKGRTPT